MDRPPGDRGKGDPETLGWEFQVRRWRWTRHEAEAPLPCALPPGWGRTVLAPQPPGLGPALPAAAWRGRPAAARLRAPGPRAPAPPLSLDPAAGCSGPSTRSHGSCNAGFSEKELLRAPRCVTKPSPTTQTRQSQNGTRASATLGQLPQQPSGCLGPSRDEPRRAAGDPASVGT